LAQARAAEHVAKQNLSTLDGDGFLGDVISPEIMSKKRD